MQLKTYLIYCLILYLVLVIRTLLYIEKEKTRRAEKKGRTKQKEREPWRRMPPTSSPVHRLSSAPSAASTVLNIASRSPPHPLATSPRVREGRSPRPLLGDVIATPRHHLATDRPATSSDRAAPRRSAILPTSSSSPSSSILQVVRVSQSRRASRREGRERTRAKDSADIFASSSPLFCSV